MKISRALITLIIFFQMNAFAKENSQKKPNRAPTAFGDFVCSTEYSSESLQSSLYINCNNTKSFSIVSAGSPQGKPAYTYCCVRR